MKKIFLISLLCVSLNIITAEQHNIQEKHKREIELLKKQHAEEIALYQQKIQDLLLAIEKHQTAIHPRHNSGSDDEHPLRKGWGL